MRFFPAFYLVFLFALQASCASDPKPLEFQMYSGVIPSLYPNSILILGEKEAVLVDGQWWLSEGKKVADMIEQSGRKLTTILITHAHPDHYMGLNPIVERFPGVRVLARPAVSEEIRYGFPGKRLHWQELVPDDIPLEAVIPEEFTGKSIFLEGHEIRFIDLPPAETIAASAFYIPSARALIAGDLIFAHSHSYLADLNSPDLWVAALNYAQGIGPIEVIYPGHGPLSSPEIFAELTAYMKTYREIAQPGMRVTKVARAMMQRYPDYEGAILLWLTRGPGYGLSGARELGVPEELWAPSPP